MPILMILLGCLFALPASVCAQVPDRQLEERPRGSIGIRIQKDQDSGHLIVESPVPDSPAHWAGIKQGDIITTIIREVDSQGKQLPKPEVIATKDLSLPECIAKILGEPNTPIEIIVVRKGEVKPLRFKIIRGNVVFA